MRLLRQTRPLTDFAPHVLANTFGDENQGSLPEAAAISYIRNSVISFAERSGILKEKMKIDLQCGLDCYPLVTKNCETIIGVKKAKLGDFSEEDCGCTWSWGSVCFEMCDDSLIISPAPTEDIKDGLEVEIIVAPSRDTCDVDAVFYDKWFDAIINGALAEIHLMPNRPWTSNSKAAYRMTRFNEDVSRASTRKVLNEVQGQPMRMGPSSNWTKFNNSQRRW
jgi:hypothetical protein